MSTLRETLRDSVVMLDKGGARIVGGSPLNTSGFDPLDLRVLILPDTAEKITAGGIILPEAEVDKKAMAMTFGTLVAAGVNAWEEAASRSEAFQRPVVGDRVVFAKYGGIEIKGRDGVKYRLMNDEDIVGREI